MSLVLVMEATGVYHERLAHFLFNLGSKVVVVLPKRAKDFSKTLKVNVSETTLPTRIDLSFSFVWADDNRTTKENVNARMVFMILVFAYKLVSQTPSTLRIRSA